MARAELAPGGCFDRGHESRSFSFEDPRGDLGIEIAVAPQLANQVERLHGRRLAGLDRLDLLIVLPCGGSSSRSRARARLSRERTVPTGTDSAAAISS
jgi:hypothetical protein